jgi:hypothetical protein
MMQTMIATKIKRELDESILIIFEVWIFNYYDYKGIGIFF